MKRSALALSPTQSAHFSMGRTLLTFVQWHIKYERPIELERAMVFDFAVQYPRTFATLVPEVGYVIKSHGFSEADLGDYFVARRYTLIRDQFVDTLNDLVARDLVNPIVTKEPSEFLLFQVTEVGTEVAGRFETRLSQVMLLLSAAYCQAWGQKDMKKLLILIRQSLPDQSDMVQQLTKPFGSWLEEK
ncbi:MAG: hypothetical protein K2X29_11025 [Candidatus Obscuribacterales bacterium]|nr:hypothetical protein [Candidatus Obscuribacterales bacterium]